MADLIVRSEDNVGYYHVVDRDKDNIIISPVDDPTIINQLIRTNWHVDIWKVYGTNDEDYQVEFLPPSSGMGPSIFDVDVYSIADLLAPELNRIVRRGLSFAKVNLPLTFIDSEGVEQTLETEQIIENEEINNGWFKYHYQDRGVAFLKDLYLLLNDPLSFFENEILVTHINNASIGSWFKHDPSTSTTITTSSPFPHPPVREWTRSEKMALYRGVIKPSFLLIRDLRLILQAHPDGQRFLDPFTTEFGITKCLKGDLNLWFVHWFDQLGTPFIELIRGAFQGREIPGPNGILFDRILNQV